MKKKSSSGQGLIEFILTLFAFFTIAFMYVQISLGFGAANYFQYATFMGARAYLSGAKDADSQRGNAIAVMEKMTQPNGKERFPNIAKSSDNGNEPKGVTIGGPAHGVAPGTAEARTKNWEQGVTYKFKMRMYMIPIVKAPTNGKGSELELESQSWLGRDPTFVECQKYMISKHGDTDNGC